MRPRIMVTIQTATGAESITFAPEVTNALREVDVTEAYVDAIDGVIDVLQTRFPSMEFELAEAYAPAIVAILEEEQHEPDGYEPSAGMLLWD